MNAVATAPSVELVNKVARTNACNAKTNEIINSLIPTMNSLVGTKVKKTSGYGGLTKSATKVLNPLEISNDHLSVRFQISHKTLCLKITHKAGAFYSQYIEEDLTVGRLDSEGTVIDMILVPNLRKTDYSAEEISATNREIMELEEKISTLKRKVYGFERMT